MYPSFKTGDVLQRLGVLGLYCVYNELEESCVIHSETPNYIAEGDLFYINSLLWTLVYRPGETVTVSEIPDALYVPNFEPEDSTLTCSCDVVDLMKVGCGCGGK